MRSRENFDRANMIRGMVISSIIMVERVVDMCLSEFLTSTHEKRIIAMDYVFAAEKTMPFEVKRRMLEALLRDFMPELHKKYVKQLRVIESQLIPMRNRFAHDMMTYEENDSDNILSLIKYKDGQVEKTFTVKDLEDFKIRSIESTDVLNEILNHIQTANPRI